MNENEVTMTAERVGRAPRPAPADAGLALSAEEAARGARYDHVLDRVRRLLIDQLHLRREPDEIDPDAVLFATGLGLDSVDAVELTVAVEAEFGVRIPDNDVSRTIFRSVNSLVEHLIAATSSQEAPHVA